ncbi:hypothetical protein D3797_001850 [Bacillus subtilis]|nr:hypothetical protein D3797_001850 [Bacillus subtilis]
MAQKNFVFILCGKAKIAKKFCVSGLEIEKGVLLLDKFLYNSTSFFRKRQNIGMILAFLFMRRHIS